MPRPSAVLAGYAALALADTWLAGRSPSAGVRAARAVTKTALMPVLAAAVPPRSPAVAIGLAGSWAGDVSLMVDDPRAFRAGVASFAVAHGGYVAALAPHVSRDRLLRSRRVRLMAGSTLASAPLMGLAAHRVDPRLGGPVTAYTLTVASMAAATQAIDADATTRRLLAVGGAVFLASDTVLGTRDLVLAGRPDASTRWMERVVMATYTLAQVLLGLGFRRLVRRLVPAAGQAVERFD